MSTPPVRVADRLVLTLALDGRDVGLLVAFPWAGGFFLEHVVVFPDAPATTLLALLQAGLDEANRREAKHIGIFQPTQGMDSRLRTVAQAFGFEPYHVAEDGVFLVKRAEEAA